MFLINIQILDAHETKQLAISGRVLHNIKLMTFHIITYCFISQVRYNLHTDLPLVFYLLLIHRLAKHL